MSVELTGIKLEVQPAGGGGAWTDITADLLRDPDVHITYGPGGTGPESRVADPSEASFGLDNSEDNSAGLRGYYSPGHVNCRAGFQKGIGVRISFVYAGVSYYKFLGALDSIMPTYGQYGEGRTFCSALDWLDEAFSFRISGLPTVLNTNAGAVFSQIIAAMSKQPNASSIATGADTYLYAMANSQADVFALAEFQRLALSDLGLVVMRGNTNPALAGQFTFLGRNELVQAPYNVSQGTFSDVMVDLDAGVAREKVINKLQMRVHPRRVDADAVTLWTLASPGRSIDPGQDATFGGQYSDPNQRAARVGGHTVSIGLNLNSRADGSGSDLSGSFTITASAGAAGVAIKVLNNGVVTGYLVSAVAIGYGIYDYDPIDEEVSDAASIASNGERPATLDLWYIGDPRAARVQGKYLLDFWKSAASPLAESMKLVGNTSDFLMRQVLGREPADMITVQETQIGVNRKYRIQQVDLTYSAEGVLYCTWSLSPQADTTLYWLEGIVGRSELNSTTVLAA